MCCSSSDVNVPEAASAALSVKVDDYDVKIRTESGIKRKRLPLDGHGFEGDRRGDGQWRCLGDGSDCGWRRGWRRG